MKAMTIIIILLMLATLGVLIIGVTLMAFGGKLNKKYANKLMVARVVLQAATLVLLGVLFMVAA